MTKIGFLLFLLGMNVQCFPEGSTSERAFDVRNAIETKMLGHYAKQFPKKWLRDIRWKNTQKSLSSCPQISELTKARVSRTTDSGDFVVNLIDVDGEECSLWLDGGQEGDEMPISGITPY